MRNPCERRDCLISPIREECLDFCIENILRSATPSDKRTILGIPNSLAEKIYEAYNVHRVRSPYDLRTKLGEENWRILKEIFKGLSQSQLDYFRNNTDGSTLSI